MREHAPVPVPEPVQPEPALAAPAPTQVLALQRSSGNQAVTRMLSRRTAEPATSASIPQQSQAPPKLTAIEHEGQFIATGVDGCRAALERVAVAQGAAAATAWATRFFNMEAARRASLEAQHGPELVAGTVAALRTAEAQFTEDNTRFLMAFETRAGNLADELLTVSEGKIRAEQERLGVKDSGGGNDQIARLRAAAAQLLPLRREADALGKVSIAARDELDRAARTDPFKLDKTASEKAEAARKTWSEAEHRYAELARAETAQQPALAMYTTGGDAAAKLQAIGSGDDNLAALRVQLELSEKLENIAEVRAALGGRFKPLKQPPVVRMTKEALAVEPYQSRLVDDHIRQLQAAEDENRQLWSLVALGLGLVAALPTAGTSVAFAATVAVAAGGAAVISAYQAYDQLQDARMQEAGADTDVEKARAISEDEPDYFWLALDIVAAIADVGAAVHALKGVRAAMRAADASKPESLRRLAAQCEAAQLSPLARGRVFSATMASTGGSLAVTLDQMLDVFRNLVPPPGEERWLEYARKMAEQMIAEDRVVTVGKGTKWVDDFAEWLMRNKGLARDEARAAARRMYADHGIADGVYIKRWDVVLLRAEGTPEFVASVFVHELTHQKQKAMFIIDRMTKLERELSAFASQRDFLKLFPVEAIPEQHRWLREATDDELFFHVYSTYNVPMDDVLPSEVWTELLAEIRGRKSGR